MAKYILGIDQSTARTKAILFDELARVVCRRDVVHKQYYPQPGWVEHDPIEIYHNMISAIKQVVEGSGVPVDEIAAISIANQRETVLLWDAVGTPACRAVVWQCTRAAELVQREGILAEKDYVLHATGLMLSPYFSAGKAAWIVENTTLKKPLMLGTMDSWVIWKLTGNHATDYSNASRTQLFNINTLQWDAKLCRLFGLEDVALPEVKFSDEIFGYTTAEDIFSSPIPVTGVMGDSHGALFAQQCWQSGMAKCTFGTGMSVMMNIGKEVVLSNHKIGTSIAWGIGKSVEYALEGTANFAGDVMQWMVNDLCLLDDSARSEELAAQVASAEGVYLVPAFAGLGAPWWADSGGAMLCGMQRTTNRCHIVRAGLESTIYQLRDIAEAMMKDTQIELKELRADGAPAKNGFLMQFAADMLHADVLVNEVEELSALGAAYVGGLAIDVWKDRKEIGALFHAVDRYSPKMHEQEKTKLYGGWIDAVETLIGKK